MPPSVLSTSLVSYPAVTHKLHQPVTQKSSEVYAVDRSILAKDEEHMKNILCWFLNYQLSARDLLFNFCLTPVGWGSASTCFASSLSVLPVLSRGGVTLLGRRRGTGKGCLSCLPLLLKVSHCQQYIFLFFLLLSRFFFWSSFWFLAKLNGRYRNFPYSFLPQCV